MVCLGVKNVFLLLSTGVGKQEKIRFREAKLKKMKNVRTGKEPNYVRGPLLCNAEMTAIRNGWGSNRLENKVRVEMERNEKRARSSE